MAKERKKPSEERQKILEEGAAELTRVYKRARAKKTASKKNTGAPRDRHVTIRMYNIGFGDAFYKIGHLVLKRFRHTEKRWLI